MSPRWRGAVVALAIVIALVAAMPAASAGTPSTSTTSVTGVPTQDIIPRPNTGTPPEDAGDRGGALQGAVFVLIMGGLVVIGLLAVRDARRKQAKKSASL